MKNHRLTLVICAAAAAAGAATAGTTPGTLILAEGDALAGGVVANLNAPFTDGVGRVGFVAQLESGERVIWYDDGPVFVSTDALPVVLTGGEGTMDVSDVGGFHYGPSVDGNDGGWSQLGPVLVETDAAPGFEGQFISFASRPRMRPDGVFYVVSGVTDVKGGSTNNRVFYEIDAANEAATPLFVAGSTVIDGLPVSTGSGIDFDYSFSDDGTSLINVFDFDTGSTTNDIGVVLNGSIVLQEGDAVPGTGETFDNIDRVDVNNHGDWIVTGDTDGDSAADEFVVLNGAVALREGDAIGGGVLTGGIDAISTNDLGEVAIVWEVDDVEALITGRIDDSGVDLSDLSILLATFDVLDLGDAGAVTVTDFNASGTIGPGLDFQEDGFVYVELDVDDGAADVEFEAIVRLAVPGPAGSPVQARWAGVQDADNEDSLGPPDGASSAINIGQTVSFAEFGALGSTALDAADLAALVGAPVEVIESADFFTFECNGTPNIGVETSTWSFSDGVNTEVYDETGSFVANISIADHEAFWGLDTGCAGDFAYLFFDLQVVSPTSPDLTVTVTGGDAEPGSPDPDAMAVLAPPVECPGDLDGDFLVGSSDLNLLLGAFGVSGDGDLDGDGETTSTDLNMLLGAFGAVCI